MASHGAEDSNIYLWQTGAYVAWETPEVSEVLRAGYVIDIHRCNHCQFGLDKISIV